MTECLSLILPHLYFWFLILTKTPPFLAVSQRNKVSLGRNLPSPLANFRAAALTARTFSAWMAMSASINLCFWSKSSTSNRCFPVSGDQSFTWRNTIRQYTSFSHTEASRLLSTPYMQLCKTQPVSESSFKREGNRRERVLNVSPPPPYSPSKSTPKWSSHLHSVQNATF